LSVDEQIKAKAFPILVGDEPELVKLKDVLAIVVKADEQWRKDMKEKSEGYAKVCARLQQWFNTFLMVDWNSVAHLSDEELLAWKRERKKEFEELLH